MTPLGIMLRKTIRVPVSIVALGVALALIGGLGAEPAPVTAAPFTCRLTKTFQMPTLEELVELYGDGQIPDQSSFLAGLDSRCLRNLVKGTYVLRMKATVTTQLSEGWPEDAAEYPQGEDATFVVMPVYTRPSPGGDRGLNDAGESLVVSPPESLQIVGLGMGALPAFGVAYSPLTALCVGERCRFDCEQSGIIFEPTGTGDYGVTLALEGTCQRIIPVSPESTIQCWEGTGEEPSTYYHPGLSGTEFTVNAEFLFEPLITWRR